MLVDTMRDIATIRVMIGPPLTVGGCSYDKVEIRWLPAGNQLAVTFVMGEGRAWVAIVDLSSSV